MPSDTLLATALDATEPARRDFLSAVRTAADEIEGRLQAGRRQGRDSAGEPARSLGTFASGRIDPARFAAFAPRAATLHPTTSEALSRAAAVLRDVARAGATDFVVEVHEGERLSRVLSNRLGTLGRAFGAAELVAATRQGRPSSIDADRRLKHYHPDDWTPREREIAPPLVVVCPGARLRVGAAREWLEHGQKFVFVVDGACPPAPLAPLLTPGAWIAQVGDDDSAREDAFHDFRDFDGPAAIAVVPGDAALFTHVPGRGVTIHRDSDPNRVHPIGTLSEWRQIEDLRALHRAAASTGPSLTPVAAPSETPPASAEAAPVDRLAAWLLKQTDLTPSD